MNLNNIVVTLSFLVVYGVVWAQGAPPATPIDGGLSIALLATGAAFGIKKIRDSRKDK